MIEPCPFRRRLDRFLFGVLAALPCVLMLRPLMEGAVPYFMDPLMYFYPLRVQAARVWAAGEWPLWNRALMGGIPLLENPQAAVVYPPNWPSLHWPTGFWFTFPQLLQLGLYGALTAWALRRLEVKRWVAVWAGLLAICGDYGWSRLQFGNYMNVLPWWGLWVGSAVGFVNSALEIRKSKIRCENSDPDFESVAGLPNSNENEACEIGHCRKWAKPARPWPPQKSAGMFLISGSLSMAMMLLGGAHQLAFYAMVALVLFGLVQAAASAGRIFWIQFIFMTFILGILIGAPGWLPQISFIRETSRVEGLRIESVLAGSIQSIGQLFYSLAGDWRVMQFARGERWADAESQAAIGVIALLLACIPGRRGARRHAWFGLWFAAIVSAALATRPVVAFLVEQIPAAGIFHDPRRWLGLTQWLLLLAAALGADHLTAMIKKRRIAVNILLSIALIAAAAGQGYMTWRTTDLAMIPAAALDDRGSLLSQMNIPAGCRFFSIDYKRDVSYDFRRPDLLEWALPNSAMLLGAEDLGGYEPAQSRRWREFMATLQDDPGRRLWPEHFALTVSPWMADLPATAAVGAMIAPRWGIPLYYRQIQQGIAAYGAYFPEFANGPLRVAAIMVAPAGTRTSIRENGAREAELLTVAAPLSPAADLALAETTGTRRIGPPPGAPHVTAAIAGLIVTSPTAVQPPITVAPPDAARPAGNLRKELAASTPTQEQIDAARPVAPVNPSRQPWILSIDSPPRPGQQARLLDVYFWNDGLARRWQPVAAGEIAAIFRAADRPRRNHWETGGGTVFNESIRHNALAMGVNVTTAPAHLVIHDAWWPGWEATIDGEPLAIERNGPWRMVELPAGTNTIGMHYRPIWLGFSLKLALAALLALLLVALFIMYRRKTAVLPLASPRDDV